jgi:hypothetical protein
MSRVSLNKLVVVVVVVVCVCGGGGGACGGAMEVFIREWYFVLVLFQNNSVAHSMCCYEIVPKGNKMCYQCKFTS